MNAQLISVAHLPQLQRLDTKLPFWCTITSCFVNHSHTSLSTLPVQLGSAASVAGRTFAYWFSSQHPDRSIHSTCSFQLVVHLTSGIQSASSGCAVDSMCGRSRCALAPERVEQITGVPRERWVDRDRCADAYSAPSAVCGPGSNCTCVGVVMLHDAEVQGWACKSVHCCTVTLPMFSMLNTPCAGTTPPTMCHQGPGRPSCGWMSSRHLCCRP